MHATSGWPESVALAPHKGAPDSGPFTANNIPGRVLNPFRPTTLVVAPPQPVTSTIRAAAHAVTVSRERVSEVTGPPSLLEN